MIDPAQIEEIVARVAEEASPALAAEVEAALEDAAEEVAELEAALEEVAE